MKKLFFIVTLFLLSFSTFAQVVDIRTGIEFQKIDTNSLVQRNFVSEVYVSHSTVLGSGFSGEASIWYNGSNLDLYTASLGYQKSVGATSNVQFTLGGFENAFYKAEKNSWRNVFITQTPSAIYNFGRTGTGLEGRLNTKYVDFSASTVSQDGNFFAPDAGSFLFTSTVRPVKSLAVTGVLFRSNVENQNFGGLVDFRHKFKKIGELGVGVEFLTTPEKTQISGSDTMLYHNNNYSAWLEFVPKGLKTVSVIGRYDTQDLSTGYYNATVGLLCRPVEGVTLGAVYSKVCGLLTDDKKNRINTNTIGLRANVVFSNFWF